MKIKGILSGSPYPELDGSYEIPSTSGYASRIEFGGKGLFSGSSHKHSFDAKVYRESDSGNPLYTLSGNWDGVFRIHDVGKDQDIETVNIAAMPTTSIITDSIAEQDPWESRLAWRDVREALRSGNMQGAANAKSKLENGQRQMRKLDRDGKDWTRLFYEPGQEDKVAKSLGRQIGLTIDAKDTVAAWKFRRRDWEEGTFQKPFHGNLLPDNSHLGEKTHVSRLTGDKNNSNFVARSVSPDGSLPDGSGPRSDSGNHGNPGEGSSSERVTPATNEAETGIAGMSTQERSQVEDFLRDKHSSSRKP